MKNFDIDNNNILSIKILPNDITFYDSEKYFSIDCHTDLIGNPVKWPIEYEQHNVRYDCIKNDLKKLEERPIVVEFSHNVVNIILSYY